MRRRVTVKLAFCPTGPGGGVDNSCSSRGGSIGERADAEKNPLVAAKLHAQAADELFTKAAQAANRDPVNSYRDPESEHNKLFREAVRHQKLAREKSEPILGADRNRQREKDKAKGIKQARMIRASNDAKTANEIAGRVLRAHLAEPKALVRGYREAAAAYRKAAESYKLAGSIKFASRNEAKAEDMDRQAKYYGERTS